MSVFVLSFAAVRDTKRFLFSKLEISSKLMGVVLVELYTCSLSLSGVLGQPCVLFCFRFFLYWRTLGGGGDNGSVHCWFFISMSTVGVCCNEDNSSCGVCGLFPKHSGGTRPVFRYSLHFRWLRTGSRTSIREQTLRLSLEVFHCLPSGRGTDIVCSYAS